MALLGLGMSACSFNGNADYQASDADPRAPDANQIADDGGVIVLADASPFPVPDAMPLTPLVDTNLVVRYFMDEASSGTAPTQLEDSAPLPMPLPITYGQASFVEDQGHRGLQWPTAAGSGKAVQTYDGTKLPGRLNPLTFTTIEVVVKIDDARRGFGSQLAGVRGGNPDFMLTATGNDTIRFIRPFGQAGATWAGVHSQERMVLHLVYDTTRGDEEERIQLYKNGTLVTKTDSSPPSQGEAAQMGNNDALVIGNERDGAGSESPQGIIYYVALYDAALGPGAVATNAARLLVSDDE